MILPIEVMDVLEDFLVDLATADVDGYVVILVVFLEELRDCLDVVAVEALETGGGKGHGDNAGADVGEVKVVAVLLVSVLGACHDLS